MEKQQSLQMNDNSQSAGCHTAPATNSLVTGSLCEYLGSALKCNNPVDTEGKYSSHTADPISAAESNVQNTAGSHYTPDLSDRYDRAAPTECHDSESCGSASETRNTEMIRRKLSVNCIHEGSGIGKKDKTCREMNSANNPHIGPCTGVWVDEITGSRTTPQTEQEGSVVSSEESYPDVPELDPNMPSIDRTLLEVIASQFRADNGKGQVSSVGRGLVCHSHISPRQEICTFVGKAISQDTLLHMSSERKSYVIDMTTQHSGHAHNTVMLDCYEESMGDNPTSLASIANCPTRLYNRVLDESYGKEDANAAVQTVIRDGQPLAILYATRHINSGEEILWNYPEWGDDSLEIEDRELITSTLMTVESCYATTITSNPFDAGYAILDTASSTHVCKSAQYAYDMLPCAQGMITGIESGTKGNTYSSSCVFIDKSFGRAPFMPSAAANIIAVAVARDQGMDMTYDNVTDEFTMVSATGDRYTFGRITGVRGKSKFYVMDISTLKPPPYNAENQCLLSAQWIESVKGNRLKYTKRENRDADIARGFIASIGYPNERVALNITRSMANCHIKTEDIRRCFDIHGRAVQQVKGTTTQKKSQPAVMELGVTTVQKEQAAEVDLMFVRGMPFLIAILTPLDFSFCIPIPDKSVQSITEALDKVLAECNQKGFIVQWVRSDNEPALCTKEAAAALSVQGVSMDKSAPGQHAPRVERRIGFVKAKYRTIVSTVLYSLTSKLVAQGVIAANRYCNMQKSSSSTSDLSPREKYLGRQLDYVRDVGTPFGTYCQATVPNTNNSDSPRTEACISLYPKESQTGSTVLMRIADSRIITRANVTALPMPDALIAHLNQEARWDMTPLDDDDNTADPTSGQEQHTEIDEYTRTVNDQPIDVSLRGLSDEAPESTDDSYDVQEDSEHVEQGDYSDPPIIRVNQESSPSRAPRLPTPSSPQMDVPSATRRSDRLSQAAESKEGYWETPDEDTPYHTWLTTTDDQHYSLMTDTSNMTCKQAELTLGDSATESIRAELQQLVDKGFAQPVMPAEATSDIKKSMIRTKMFIKAKTLPDGRPGKVKSRLVARGDMQLKEHYMGEDLSASTPDSISTFTVIAIAASEHRHIMAADIGGAYLNAPMEESAPAVYISIEPRLAQILGTIDPAYKRAIQPNGTIIAKLKKCLYGCIESAKRWQTHVLAALIKMGFESNSYDQCILNKTTENGQITVIIYVDDLLITSKSLSDVHAVRDAVIAVYKDVKSQDGPIVDFLGMSIDMSTPGTAKITMDGMVEKIVKDSKTENLDFVTRSPAADDLFDTTTESPRLDEARRQHFHTITARLAYLARRVKPEILLAVSMLATRVTIATEIDQGKLDRVIRYMHQSHNKGQRGIQLSPGDAGIRPFGYFDASYGVHVDGKSHTGACITIGSSGPICTESVRQSIVTKSSTEAELVAMSDSANQLIHVRNLLIAQGHPQSPATIYQDNMSCMALVDKGKATSKRSRHIDIRYFWIHERAELGEVRLVHRPTEIMGPANVLTKPTQGAQFIEERFQLTNWNI
jgi:hypothetical protein